MVHQELLAILVIIQVIADPVVEVLHHHTSLRVSDQILHCLCRVEIAEKIFEFKSKDLYRAGLSL